MKSALQPLPRALLCAGLILAGLPSAEVQAAPKSAAIRPDTTSDLERKIDLLMAQNQALAARVAALEAERSTPRPAEQQAAAQAQHTPAEAQIAQAKETQAELKAQGEAIANLQRAATSNAAALERAG